MKADALRGHLDAMILSSVEGGPLHGYAIIEALAVRSGGALDLPTGTVYPALRRLEAAGYLASTWSSDSGRKRRTYRLSRSGAKALTTMRADWSSFAEVVTRVLLPAR
jgi:DNA-binding PadR family transcriptional regulator